MDGTGGNRYELLFMDDDASDPLDALVKKSKTTKQKQKNATATAAATTATTTNKQTNQQTNQTGGNNKKTNIGLGSAAEKENKSSAMNKNVEKKTGGQQGQGPVNAAAAAGQQKQKGPTTTGGQFKDQQSGYRNGQDQRQQPREGKNERNVNFKQQNGETREQRNNRRNRDERPPQQQHQQQQQQQQQNGTIAPGEFQQNTTERPQRRGPPTRRNFEGGRGGKREFDRQSGSDKTGVKAIDKRDGAGAHNWGSLKQDIEDLNKSQEEVLTDKDDSTGDQQAEQQPVNVEEETKELTLDEWKAQRAVRAKPQYNIRKAGEGEDLSQWKKMIALNNKKREDGSEEEFEYDPSMYPQRVGRLQRVLDIEFHFNDGRRGAGVRGRGRSRGQPGGGGGGPGRQGRVPRNVEPKVDQEGAVDRLQRGGQNAPKVDDEHDFPSLG